MPKTKSKKRKLNHGQPNRQGNSELTHEEIWDDSALLRSWNDAVAEYEFYHSIHAKGQNLDEVLKQYEADAETGEVLAEAQAAVEEGDVEDEDGEIAEEGEIEDDDVSEIAQVGKEVDMESAESVGHETQTPPPVNVGNTAKLPFQGDTSNQTLQRQPSRANGTNTTPSSLPKTGPSLAANPDATPVDAIGSSDELHSQTLENIKMAYYWAGYYSGLFDGQRQSQTPTKPQDHA